MPHSTRSNHSSESSRRYSKHQNQDRQYYRPSSSSTRGFDCCSRSSSHPPSHSHSSGAHSGRDYPGSSSSATYGTYVWPLDDSRRYVTDDPLKCRCNCCPHPTYTTKKQDERRNPDYNSSRGEPYDTGRRKSYTPSSRTQDRRHQADDQFLLQVVDFTQSSNRRKYGHSYPITLSKTASINSIVTFLAPDKRRARVVVHWSDGEVEPLGEQVPINELRKYGNYLEVREKPKKRVHWA